MALVIDFLRTRVNWFVTSLVILLVLGILIPLPAGVVEVLRTASRFAVVALFLVYGARLHTSEVVAGFRNWRLQAAVLAATFLLFPLIGVVNGLLVGTALGPEASAGMQYLTILPSTVQSSIAFTSIAGGNVAAAVAAATISNLIGVIATPLLVALTMGESAPFEWSTVWDVVLLILLPFVVGQLLQRRIGDWLRARPLLTTTVDRGTIYLVVAAATSGATRDGLWSHLEGVTFLVLLADCTVVLALMLAATWYGGRAARFPEADRIALLMCGSKKSLATGLPMAMIIFPPAMVGAVTVPVMTFHIMQLLVCSTIAARLARRHAPA